MKITFLFGSGADTDACCDLMSGQAFSAELLKNSFSKEIENITGINASYFRLLYPRSTKIFIQTIVSNKNRSRELFGDDIVNLLVDYYEGKKKDDCWQQISLLCKTWYDCLKENDGENEIRDFFLQTAVLFDSLDEKFNSLRNINYNSNAKRVINAYFTVFLIIFKALYNVPNDFNWCYEELYNMLNQEYSVTLSETGYYKLLSERSLDCNIVTTNYTEIASIQTKRSDVIYLHGKLTWFEDLKNLTVYDCTVKDERAQLDVLKNIIPFILIPSGVKPLICKKQIYAFSEFVKKLDDSQCLVVVGYKFNSEDNHINSIIAEWLRTSQKKLVYLNYEKLVDFSALGWVSDFGVFDNEDCENSSHLISNEKITNLIVNKDNSRKIFEKLLNELDEECYGSF